jgi:hypothetical protein
MKSSNQFLTEWLKRSKKKVKPNKPVKDESKEETQEVAKDESNEIESQDNQNIKSKYFKGNK